jgi:hypothetical protein
VQLVIDHAARPEQSAGGLVLPVQVTDRQNPGHGGELGGTRHLRLGADPDRWQIKARNIEREALAHMNPAFDPLAVTDGDDAGTIRFPEHVGTVADRRGGLLGKRRAPTSRDDYGECGPSRALSYHAHIIRERRPHLRRRESAAPRIRQLTYVSRYPGSRLQPVEA